MNNINHLKQEIELIISKSNVPEDPVHALNTLDWLLKLNPNADEALKIAALGHDIERALEDFKVRREDFPDYDAFKSAHAKNSARLLKKMMQNYHVKQDITDEVYRLVCCHETGGDLRSDLIRDADSISFFDVNLPLYFEREGWEKSWLRCQWGYQRLSPHAKQIVKNFSYKNDEINALMKTIFNKKRPDTTLYLP